MDEPLIFTSKGNLPVASLEYKHEWQENENEITLVEEYWLGDELVKRNVHCKLKRGLDSALEQQLFG